MKFIKKKKTNKKYVIIYKISFKYKEKQMSEARKQERKSQIWHSVNKLKRCIKDYQDLARKRTKHFSKARGAFRAF